MNLSLRFTYLIVSRTGGRIIEQMVRETKSFCCAQGEIAVPLPLKCVVLCISNAKSTNFLTTFGGYVKMRAMFCGTFLFAKRPVFIPQVHPVAFSPASLVYLLVAHCILVRSLAIGCRTDSPGRAVMGSQRCRTALCVVRACFTLVKPKCAVGVHFFFPRCTLVQPIHSLRSSCV